MHTEEVKTSSHTGIHTRIFTGFLITSTLKMHLNQSDLWKQAGIDRPENGLIQIDFHSHSYIGSYTANEHCTLQDLQLKEQNLKTQIASYCPTLEIDSLSLCLFPQVFIS